jgi:hypothetical protein
MRTTLLIAVSFVVVHSSAALAQPAMYEGRPAFAEGTELGYYIWKDGQQWHVRWTTKGAARRFTGTVVADAGEFHKLKRVDVESESRVLYPGRPRHVVVGPRGRARVVGGRAPVVVSKDQDKVEKEGDRLIVFNALTVGDIDGFDFTTDDRMSELRFTMQVNGQPMPNIIEVGKNNDKPHHLPLVVQLK